MKILLVSQAYRDSFPPRNLSMGSAVKQATELSKAHDVTVLTCGRKVTLERKPGLNIISVPGLLLPDPINYVISLPLIFRFISLAKKLKPDVVLVSKFMFFSSLVIPVARILGLKVITTTDTFPGINWFPRSWLVGLVMRIYARVIGLPLLMLSHKVILLYPGLQTIADRYHLNSVVIPNGVENSLLHKLPLPKGIYKPKDEFWVGFVGRAESVKGYDIALKTTEMLKDHPRIKFIFIGGNQREKTVNNKIFLGFRSDVYNYYQLFDVLILPSLSEGLPNVVMEAMAQKVPVIAHRVGGVSDLLVDGKNGLFVTDNSPQSFALSILHLYQNPRLRNLMSAAARNHIAKDFNWQKNIHQYSKIFQVVK